MDIEIFSENCEVCGAECFNVDLYIVKLAGDEETLHRLCKSCRDMTIEKSFMDAAELVQNIAKIASEKENSFEDRLKKIRDLLE